MNSLNPTGASASVSEQPRPIRAFLAELAQHPRQMGAFWPSSRTLAQAMARRLPKGFDHPVLELGPGTGVVTEALFARGLPPHRLVAVEKSTRLADVLRRRFPGARIVAGDALELDTLLRGERFGAVVSSLPLKVFSKTDVARLAACVRTVLNPSGCWIQFTYQVFNGGLPAATFRRVSSDIVWFNFPPALICVFKPVARVG